jgi:hypothetical protein
MSVRLACLGGAPSPEGLAADLETLFDLPPTAVRAIWTVLSPSLEHPISAAVEQRLAAFAKEHSVNDNVLGRALRASRFLLREAASRNLPWAVYEADLRQLTDNEVIVELHREGYARAVATIRGELINRSRTSFGPRVVGLGWRMELGVATHELDALGDLLVKMLFVVREGSVERPMQLELGLDGVRSLREACEAIEARAQQLGSASRKP